MRTWITVDSPLGPLTLVAGARGLSHVFFPTDTPKLNATTRLSEHSVPPHAQNMPDEDSSSHVLRAASRQLSEYFAGARQNFDLVLDRPSPPRTFLERAQHILGTIPYGERWTYAHLAQEAGSPRAVRAAGSACANNPLPIVMPCHRIVRADGRIGAYRGGSEAKRFLLELEEHHCGM